MRRLFAKPLWVLDLLAVLLLFWIRWGAHVREAPDPAMTGVAALPSWWWTWGSVHDWVLVGPDAGHWAANAEAWMQGAPLDPHRLPFYTLLTAWGGRVFGDVVFAGHMVNHSLSLLTCVLAYGLGCLLSGRAVGLGAAVLCAWSPELVNNKLFYGVDPSLQFVVLLLAVCTALTLRERRVWLVLLGLVCGVTLATHFFAMCFPPLAIGLVICLREGSWKKRLGGAAGVLVLALLVWKVLLWRYPDVGLGFVASIYGAGVGSNPVLGNTEPVANVGIGAALELVMSRLPSAPGLAVQRSVRSLKVEGVPWGLLVLLFWLGLVGWRSRLKDRKWEWRSGLLLLVFLLPLVLLEAARAPDRYALYARPLVFVCVLRGAISLVAIGEAALRRWTSVLGESRVAAQVVALALVLGGVFLYRAPFTSRWNLRPPVDEGMQSRAVAALIDQEFPDSDSVVTSSQAIPFHARREACPSNPCPQGGQPALARCLAQLVSECRGQGPIPYVLRDFATSGEGDQQNQELVALVRQEFQQVGEISAERFQVSLWSLDRSRLQELSAALNTAN